MFTTKIRTALAVAGATLGVVVPALAAQAAAPTRPPTIRLQGASTTVTAFHPAGTRNVYLRATTIKRTLSGTIVRAVNRVPIRWTVTKPIILDGKVVARISAGATGQGASQAQCNSFADMINAWDDLAAAAWNNGDHEAAGNAASNSMDEVDAALDAGCFVVY
jgi:hypothetical protein